MWTSWKWVFLSRAGCLHKSTQWITIRSLSPANGPDPRHHHHNQHPTECTILSFFKHGLCFRETLVGWLVKKSSCHWFYEKHLKRANLKQVFFFRPIRSILSSLFYTLESMALVIRSHCTPPILDSLWLWGQFGDCCWIESMGLTIMGKRGMSGSQPNWPLTKAVTKLWPNCEQKPISAHHCQWPGTAGAPAGYMQIILFSTVHCTVFTEQKVSTSCGLSSKADFIQILSSKRVC